MISKETTMAAAVALVSEIILNYNEYGTMDDSEKLQGELEKAIVNNEISGVFSEVSFTYGTSAEDLKAYYGREVFDMKPRMETASGVHILDAFATIDNIMTDVPINDLEKDDYEEKFYEFSEEELETAPSDVFINQVLQVMDWEALWKDRDFTRSISDSEKNLYPQASRLPRIFDVNAALESYGLPTLKEFIYFDHQKLEDDESALKMEKKAAELKAMNPRLYGSLVSKSVQSSPIYESTATYTHAFRMMLFDDYLAKASEHPRLVRAFGYVNSES